MMRRAQEVNELIAANASSNLILATLDDYQSDVWTYNINDATVLKYCRSKLRMAAPNASSEVRAAIYRTIGSFPSLECVQAGKCLRTLIAGVDGAHCKFTDL